MQQTPRTQWSYGKGQKVFLKSSVAPRSSKRFTETVCMSSTTKVQPKVAIITTLGCPYCAKAKSALTKANIDFVSLDLTEQPELLATIKQTTGQVTVPQVFINGSLFGGSQELVEALNNGTLAQLLQTASASPFPDSITQAINITTAKSNGAAAAPQSAIIKREQLQYLAEALHAQIPALNTMKDRTFTVQSAKNWLQYQGHPRSSIQALSAMQAAQLVTFANTKDIDPYTPIDEKLYRTQPKTKLRLVSDIGIPRTLNKPLNGHFRWFGEARSADVVSADLRRIMLDLFSKHLTPDGKKVDYRAMARDPAFRQYVDATAELQKVKVENLSRDEALSFWINIYNALVLHAVASVGPATSTFARMQWFDNISYEIDGQRFTSNHIEHGVLRGNAPSPANLLSLLGKPEWAGRTFSSDDPRAKLAIQPVDPRIHFALNCGAVSCPPIKVYTPDRIETGLEAAAQAFCTSEVEVDEAANTLTMSMIYKWYGGDFGDKEQLLRFIADHITMDESKQALGRMLAKAGPGAAGIELKYWPYDWGTNAKA